MRTRIMTSMILCLNLFLSMNLSSQQSKDPHINDFDFWLGEWTVYITGTETIAGYSTISSIVGGNALQEHYRSAKNYEGISLNKYNAIDKRWEQYYVDNTGLTLHMLGQLEGNKMVMSNSQMIHGVMTDNRMSWTPNEDGTVRQVWEQKPSSESKWNLSFDGTYKAKQ